METDHLLIRRAIYGDERALRQLWSQYAQHIDGVIRRLVGDPDLAADIAQDVWMQIFRALLENAASEQGARMSAMDNATRNAGDMIRRQTLTYNRTRQAMITKELIEIISGAEAL